MKDYEKLWNEFKSHLQSMEMRGDNFQQTVACAFLQVMQDIEDVIPEKNLTPAQENAYKGSPLRSSHKPIDGVVDHKENAVQPVFHIGDKIRYKSTGTIEKISTISHGGRFINGVNSNDVELVKEK